MAGGEKLIVSGNKLADKVKELIRQGNIKRVRLIHEEKVLIDIPLTVGAPASAVIALAAPVLAALAAVAARIKECTI